MSSVFPGAIDDFDTSMTSGGLMNSPSHAAQHQKIGDALEKIETHALGLDAFAPGAALADPIVAGASAFKVVGTPPAMFNSRYFVFAIDEGSYKCEVVWTRSEVAGTFTLWPASSFHFDHAAGATVRWLQDGFAYPSLFGGKNDATTDDWRAIQRCMMTGRSRGQYINAFKQPVFFGAGTVAWDWNIWAVSGYGPVQAFPLAGAPGDTSVFPGIGYAFCGARSMGLVTSADAATNRISFPGGSGLSATDHEGLPRKVAINDPYNDGGLPGGVVAGQIYWFASLVDTPGSAYFTLSSTPDGLTPVDVTSTGKGVFWTDMDSDFSQLDFRKFRIELNVPDVSGIRVTPQQPSLFDSLYISMNANPSALKKAVGMWVGGQGAEFRNLNINTQNCLNALGMYCGSSFINFDGLTCIVGVAQPMQLSGTAIVFDVLEIEVYQTICGIEFVGVARNMDLGTVYDSGGILSIPTVLDSTLIGADWKGRFNTASSGKKLIVSPVLDAPLYSWDGGPPQTGITDQNMTTPEIVGNSTQGFGYGSILFSTRSGATNGSDSNWTFRQNYRWWNIRAEAADRTGTLHSAVGFSGLDYLVRRSSGTHNVIIAAPAGQTINGASTFTITDGNVHTIWSDGGNWWAA